MRRDYKFYIISLFLLLFSFQFVNAKSKEEINWITFEELAVLQEESPKKVMISVYTSWCGWCKRMDKQIFANEDLAKYVNEHYYAVKLDAETKKSIHFKGQEYKYVKDYKVNELAAVLLQGQMSYPNTIIMMEDMRSVENFPGYMDLPVIESILKFFGSNAISSKPWKEFQNEFKSDWKP